MQNSDLQKKDNELTHTQNKIKKKEMNPESAMKMDSMKKMQQDMSAMNHGKKMDHDMSKMEHGRGMYGSYPMMRESSGTSWLPDSSPMDGIHFKRKDWSFMLHGFSYLVFDHQRGIRGDKKIFDENMFMFTAQEDLENDTVAFRSMFSLEPLTIGKCGYPLLFQTGETCDGKTPLIDRQHPHDLFMELALVYTHLFENDSSLFFYFGLPGEPALGPPVYIMRFSSEYNPEAPLGHHWMDSTHITFGVATLGYVYNNFKIEACTFKGREPDEDRFDIEFPKFDSFSFRLSCNPTENWALQTSYGFIKSPEKLEPNINIQRFIISALYNKSFENDSNLGAAVILGVNRNKPGNILPAFLIEATYEYQKKHMFFTRFETVVKDELFIIPDPLTGTKFNINKFTFGYIYEFLTKNIKWGLGGLIDVPILPKTLDDRYESAFSYMLFLQMRLI